METAGARARRSLRLASLPLGAAGLAIEGLARRAVGEDREEVRQRLRERNARHARRVLGEAKGGALKAGQLLATVAALFPEDPEATWAETLGTFTDATPAVPFATLEPVLEAELGAGWRGRLPDLDEQPAAAASLGQVHRATWPDGRPVAVKVQYPGITEALRFDMRVVGATSRVAAAIAPGLALPPLVAEMRARLAEELDYEHEAAAQRAFAESYRGDPRVAVPDVLLAAPRVLVSTWQEGTPLRRVAAEADQPTRDRVAARYMRFLLSGPERTGLLHTDPHPGNFRLTPDGRLGVLDFGSTLALPGGMPRTVGRLLTILRSGDEDRILAGLRAEGFVAPGAELEAGKLADYLAPFTVPAGQEWFHFDPAWLRSQFGRVNDPRNPDFGVALQLRMPPEQLFTHRVWLGCVGVLCQLDATIRVREEIERWLPGFEADAGARP